MNRQTRLGVVLGLNLILIVALMTVGLAAHSVAVLAEGVDYLADAAAIAVAILAGWLATRPPTARRPDGYPRAHVIAALINAGWLLALAVLVVTAAVVRLVHGVHHVHGLPVLIVSGIAAVVMLGGALILGGDVDDRDADADADLSLRAVLLDTAADAVAAAGVAVTGAVILVSGGWYWLDPAVALGISLVVGYHAARLLREIVGTLHRQPRAAKNDTISGAI